MAGLFDFSSAEDILKQRMATTEKNRLQMLRDVSQGAPRPDVARLGANLGYILGRKLFGGQSDTSKVEDARASGEALLAAQAAGAGSTYKEGFTPEGSSYSPEALEQFRKEDQDALGLLDPELKKEVIKKRLLDGADLSTSAGTSEFAEKARAYGIAKADFMQNTAFDVNQNIDRQKDPEGHLTAWVKALRGNPLTQKEATTAEGRLMTHLLSKDKNSGRKIPKANTLSAVESHMINTGLAEQLPDDSVTAAKYWMSEKVEEYMREGMTTGEAMVQASIDLKPHMGMTPESFWGFVSGDPTLDIPGAVNPDEEVADVPTKETTDEAPNPMGVGSGRFTVKRKGAE